MKDKDGVWEYTDIIRNKKGKLRTWLGHIRAIKKIKRQEKEAPERFRFERPHSNT